jgi:Substrate binding domain of ABC-type glycine betaine transport system
VAQSHVGRRRGRDAGRGCLLRPGRGGCGAARAHARHCGGGLVQLPGERVARRDLRPGVVEAGVPARLQLGLGPRERVQPALAGGVVDVVPEYLGAALASLEPAAAATGSGPLAVRHGLARALARWDVQVLQPAAAQNQDGLAVTRATATRLRLRTVSDLVPLAPQMVLAGAPECPQRPSKPVLRDKRLAPEPHLRRRPGAEVANPVGVRSPGGADDGLSCVRVVPQYHRDSLVRSAGLASGVDEHRERVAEQPSGVMAVGP